MRHYTTGRERESVATGLLIHEGYPSEPVTGRGGAGGGGGSTVTAPAHVPWSHAAHTLHRKYGRDTSMHSRMDIGQRPPDTGQVYGNVYDRAKNLKGLINNSRGLSDKITESTLRQIEYYATVEAPPLTSAEVTKRLRTPPAERQRRHPRSGGLLPSALTSSDGRAWRDYAPRHVIRLNSTQETDLLLKCTVYMMTWRAESASSLSDGGGLDLPQVFGQGTIMGKGGAG